MQLIHPHLPAPTRGNLRGPIPEGSLPTLPHACMPWRLFGGETFMWLRLKPITRNGGCILGECPSAAPVSGAGSSVSDFLNEEASHYTINPGFWPSAPSLFTHGKNCSNECLLLSTHLYSSRAAATLSGCALPTILPLLTKPATVTSKLYPLRRVRHPRMTLKWTERVPR